MANMVFLENSFRLVVIIFECSGFVAALTEKRVSSGDIWIPRERGSKLRLFCLFWVSSSQWIIKSKTRFRLHSKWGFQFTQLQPRVRRVNFRMKDMAKSRVAEKRENSEQHGSSVSTGIDWPQIAQEGDGKAMEGDNHRNSTPLYKSRSGDGNKVTPSVNQIRRIVKLAFRKRWIRQVRACRF